MVVKDILYVALSTILVMAFLQVTTFMVTRMLYPPEARVIYRDVPVYREPPPTVEVPQQNGPVLTQRAPEVQIPEYEPRKPATTSLRMDPELPAGLQETRPDGT